MGNKKKKKANGEGTISWDDKKKRWIGRLSVGRNNNGTIKRKYFSGKTKLEVIEQMQKYNLDLKNGLIPENDKINLQEWIKLWIFEYKKNESKPSTIEKYDGLYRNYVLNSQIGALKLKDIRTLHLQLYYKNLISEGKSANIIHTINKMLKSALNQAVNDNYLIKNYCNNVTLPKKTPSSPRKVFSNEEIAKIIETSKNHVFYELFLLGTSTGLRIGELLGLKWSDIDFKENTLKVNRSIKRVKTFDQNSSTKTEIIIQDPKTEKSKRDMPIPSPIISILKKYKVKQNEEILKEGENYSNEGWVFCTNTGKLLDARNVLRSFERLLKKANISYKPFHSLRHTYATLLFEKDAKPKTIQELMGHSDINTTLAIYTHVNPTEKTKAVQKLNDIFINI